MQRIGFVVLCMALVSSRAASADGIPSYYDRTGWHLLAEDTQHAVIALRDGRQTMLLGVRVSREVTPKTAAQLSWVIPIPADPKTVKIDVLGAMPRFFGIDPRGALRARLWAGLWLASATQLWTLVPGTLLLAGKRAHDADQVDVIEKVQRAGVTVELLAVPSKAALMRHLDQRQIRLPPKAYASLRDYFGQGRSLVLYRVSDLSAYRAATKRDDFPELGIEVDFPTREGFFPLVASSALPGRTLSVRVTVLGHAQAANPVGTPVRTRHLLGKLRANPALIEALGVSRGQRVRYTRFAMRGPPSAYKADLRFRPGASVATRVASGIIESGRTDRVVFVVSLLVFIGCAIGAAFICRPLWPRAHRPGNRTFVLLGLANLLTLVAVLIAARVIAARTGSTKRVLVFALAQSSALCALLLSCGALIAWLL